eukprot:9266095-Pyramimonas_sp.AAC.1
MMIKFSGGVSFLFLGRRRGWIIIGLLRKNRSTPGCDTSSGGARGPGALVALPRRSGPIHDGIAVAGRGRRAEDH